jgi:uncharacterized membrane protein YcaP (DUF421 family)
MEILGFDLQEAFTPDVSIFETIVRGALMYIVVLVLIRYVMRGQTSTSMPSLLVIVLIADAAQNAMSTDYNSITNGIVLVATIIVTAMALNVAARYVPVIDDIVNPERRPLVINGRIIRKTLAKELMTEDELMSQLRLQGVEQLEEVKASYLEGTGEISVIKTQPDDSGGKKKSTAGAGA